MPQILFTTHTMLAYSVPRAPAGTSSAMACPAQWQARAGAAQYATNRIWQCLHIARREQKNRKTRSGREI